MSLLFAALFKMFRTMVHNVVTFLASFLAYGIGLYLGREKLLSIIVFPLQKQILSLYFDASPLAYF